MTDKETELVDLNANLSKEEEEIVDSIINELNDGDNKVSGGPPSMSEEDKQRMIHEQQMMQQQRMMQQQQMMQQKMMQEQQMMQQQQQQQPKDLEEDKKKENDSIIDKLKVDLKDPAIVSIIAFVLLMPQSDSIITMTKLEFLLNVDGTVGTYGYFIKALIVGLLFYLYSKYT